MRQDLVLGIALKDCRGEKDAELERRMLEFNCVCASVAEAKRRGLPTRERCRALRCRADSDNEWHPITDEEPEWRREMLNEYRTCRLQDLGTEQDDEVIRKEIRQESCRNHGTPEHHGHQAREDMLVKMSVEDQKKRRRGEVYGRSIGRYRACAAIAEATRRGLQTREQCIKCRQAAEAAPLGPSAMSLQYILA